MHYTVFNFLDEAQLDLLNNHELIQYMDDFLTHREYEEGLKFEEKHRCWAVQKGPRLLEFQVTNFYKNMDNGELQRKLIRKLFDYILHMQYVDIHPSWSNLFIYSNPIYKLVKDSSSTIQIKQAHFNQVCIITARNQLELFMNIIYLLEKGEKLEGKSKTKKFLKNIFCTHTKWIYFVPYMLDMISRTRTLRDPEVHSCSLFPKKILSAQVGGLSNNYMDMSNMLRNIRKYLMQLIDTDKKLCCFSVYNHKEDNGEKYEKFHAAYLLSNYKVTNEYIEKLYALSKHN